VEVVKLLLRQGADIDAHNNNDQTAATLALANNKADVASILADYEADPTGQNALHSITPEAAQEDGDKDKAEETTTSTFPSAATRSSRVCCLSLTTSTLAPWWSGSCVTSVCPLAKARCNGLQRALRNLDGVRQRGKWALARIVLNRYLGVVKAEGSEIPIEWQLWQVEIELAWELG
jgi:hypothetical protein